MMNDEFLIVVPNISISFQFELPNTSYTLIVTVTVPDTGTVPGT
jgi:hypothetical protein